MDKWTSELTHSTLHTNNSFSTHTKMAVFLTLALFLKYVVPSFVENSEYKRLDAELKPRLAPLHHLISMCENPEDLKLLGDKVSIELSTFCSEHKELFEDNVKNPSKKFVSHQNKTIAELEALKKVLRKQGRCW